MGERWNDVDPAPYNTAVEVRTFGNKVFRARLVPDGSMTMDEKYVDQWQAEEAEKHPRDWCDGCCWDSNSDGVASDPVVAWRPIAALKGSAQP